MSQFTQDPVDAADFSTARRTLLLGTGTALLASAAGLGIRSARAEGEAPAHSHAHHMHTVDLGRQRVIDHATDCVVKGHACVQHCIELFKQGDTATAGCVDAVQEMLPACDAMARLAAYDSRHLEAMIQVCIGICEDCEGECRKHADTHAECKACADACADCIEVCKEYLA